MADTEKVKKIVEELTTSSNKELIFALDVLNKDFEDTKLSIINLTKHLDNVEIIYNRVLKELNNRTNG